MANDMHRSRSASSNDSVDVRTEGNAAARRSDLERARTALARLQEQTGSVGLQMGKVANQENARQQRHLLEHQVQRELEVLAELDIVLPPEVAPELQLLSASLGQDDVQMSAHGGGGPTSSRELWERLASSIGQIGKEYLGVYEHVVAQYVAFYQSFSDILAQMGGWITSSSDGNNVTLNVQQLRNALNALRNQYSLPNKDAVLFPVPSGDGTVQGTDRESAGKWATELGLPDSCVREFPAGSGRWVVTIDMGPINTMIANLPSGNSATMDNARFQAWKSGFDAQEEKMKNTLQTLTQKYNNANSLYDNLVKVLSNTISALLETDKAFLQV
ncbi:hypothetical protein WJ64_32765 [Burkholderia ubonensis]|nr:hypothetical protein WJ64_32765 [Burkholderia ubonensis]